MAAGRGGKGRAGNFKGSTSAIFEITMDSLEKKRLPLTRRKIFEEKTNSRLSTTENSFSRIERDVNIQGGKLIGLYLKSVL